MGQTPVDAGEEDLEPAMVPNSTIPDAPAAFEVRHLEPEDQVEPDEAFIDLGVDATVVLTIVG